MKLFNIKNKKLFVALLIVYILIVVSLIVPVRNYELDLPGNITPISEEIKITNTKSNQEFYSIYVLSYNRPTLFQLLIGKLSDQVEISKITVNTTPAEDFARGALLEELSFQHAIINAYEKAALEDETIFIDYEFKSYAITYSVNENLEVGDKFIAVDGKDISEFNSEEELSNYFKENAEITLKLLQENKQTKDVIIKKNNGLFGIAYDRFYEIKATNPTYTTYYEGDNKVGPSGGLLQTLEIYSLLTNRKYNKIISGTGTIEFNGNVGAIGAVKQKIYTANGKVDIFFCPEYNYEEALLAYNNLKNPTFELVKVKTLDEAIEKLLT